MAEAERNTSKENGNCSWSRRGPKREGEERKHRVPLRQPTPPKQVPVGRRQWRKARESLLFTPPCSTEEERQRLWDAQAAKELEAEGRRVTNQDEVRVTSLEASSETIHPGSLRTVRKGGIWASFPRERSQLELPV